MTVSVGLPRRDHKVSWRLECGVQRGVRPGGQLQEYDLSRAGCWSGIGCLSRTQDDRWVGMGELRLGN